MTNTSSSPAPALARLIEQNRSWAREEQGRDPGIFDGLSATHAPVAMVVGCCDARVSMDQALGVRPGEIFYHRNVANLVRPSDAAIGASMEFCLGVLRAPHLIVCGHSRCGGIQASLAGHSDGDLGRWIAPVRSLVGEVGEELEALDEVADRVEALARMNVVRQVANALRHPAVQARLDDRAHPLQVHGWYYRIEEGMVEEVELPRERWQKKGLLPG
ncbi:MAG: hypothetical protein EA352_12570 [Gemmatimonadales bacterium]|nr:MAG: hypothetical protein EA352_12570 [Gemmatimonadales bacterium]